MNILYLAMADYVGVGHKYFRAINDTFEEHKAQHVSYRRHRLGYPIQHFSPKPKKLEKLIEWADVVHSFDIWQRFRKRIPEKKPLVVTQNGTYFRRHHESAMKLARERGLVQLCTTLDLARHGARWMPVPLKDHGIRMRERGGGPWRIVHSPSKPEIKGTAEFLQAMKKLPGVEFDLIQNTANKLCVERKARGDIMFNEFDLGYGVSALESWWIGQVVVSGVSDAELYDLMERYIGYVPFVKTNRRRIVRTMRQLMRDPDRYEIYRQRGMAYVREFHDPARVAQKLIDVYKEVI